MASRSLRKRVWYRALQAICQLATVALFHVRCRGYRWVPKDGGALVLSNHQSHLDPVLVGVACNRRLNYLARKTLFRFAPLRWLIDSLDAIPIDREGTGFGGLKETLRRLKREEMVLLFPEGTRTSDGEVAPLKPGFCALAKRAGVPLVPVAVAGAFDAWPRWRRLPRRTVIHVVFGPPVSPEQIADLAERELLAEVERRIVACQEQARASRRRAVDGRANRRAPQAVPECRP
jgi:1-acyl-sn-glycerol-3-phosphate acyltransferase